MADNGRLDEAIRSLEQYRWVIFTSVNGVAAFWAAAGGLRAGQARFHRD